MSIDAKRLRSNDMSKTQHGHVAEPGAHLDKKSEAALLKDVHSFGRLRFSRRRGKISASFLDDFKSTL